MESIGSGGYVALIASQDEYYRLALRALLRARMGFSKVLESASLDEAMDGLSGSPGVSIAVFDLCLPGVENVRDLREVRACFPGLVILAVSDAPYRRQILEVLDAGAHGYVPKNATVPDLIAALNSMLIGNIYVPPLLGDVSAPLERSPTHPLLDESSELTPRQWDVLRLIVQGKSNKEIARELNLREGTIKVHIAALFRALGVRTRSAAAALGAKLLDR